MSKAVLLSVQPEWCELIASGMKTIEIRKTRPKLEPPFKCYIYCAKEKELGDILWCSGTIGKMADKSNGKVIGEFVCDSIQHYEAEFHNGIDLYYEEVARIVTDANGDEYPVMLVCNRDDPSEYCGLLRDASMTFQQLKDYADWDGFGKLYGWHISDLVIYDKPKELSKFYTECDMGCEDCDYWKLVRVNADEFDMDCDSGMHGHKPIKRAPQSWRYVEEMR